jgi:hypothetical protein
MLTSLQYKCVNKQTRWVRVRRVFKVRNFRTRTSEKSADSDSDSDVRKALLKILSVLTRVNKSAEVGNINFFLIVYHINIMAQKVIYYHSVLTREKPRLLSTYKTDRSNHKQDKTAGLRPGRTIVKQDCRPMAGPDWDTTASLWPDMTAGLWPNKTARQNYFEELRRP